MNFSLSFYELQFVAQTRSAGESIRFQTQAELLVRGAAEGVPSIPKALYAIAALREFNAISTRSV
jgi:hypothetical protein